MRAIDRFEKFSKPVHNGQDHLKNKIFDGFPVVRTQDVTDHSQVAKYKHTHDYVWLVHSDVTAYHSFPWYFKPKKDEPVQIHAFPYVYKESRKVKSWDMCQLVPTDNTAMGVKQHIHVFGEYDVYCGKDRFDIFYVGNNTQQIQGLSEKFGNVHVVDSVRTAMQNSSTDMLWIVYDDTVVRDTFKFTYHPDDWSHDFAHVFGNGNIDQLDGVVLLPKHYPISDKEIKHRFFANKKEIRIMASNPRGYDQFTVNSYNDYLHAMQNSTTDLFWGIPSDVEVAKDFDFNWYFSHHNRFDRNINHVLLNGEHRDGVVLYSKHSPVTEKEIEHRFIADKKQWDIVASNPKQYNRFTINSYDDYLHAMQNSTTDLFWGIPDDVIVESDFDFDWYFSHHNRFDRNINHVLLNGEHRDGIVLYSKNSKVSKREVEHRFFANKKQWDVVASRPKQYDRFTINSYEDYTQALKNSQSEMFWGIPDDVIVESNFDFDLYFTHYNKFDRDINHVFLNDKSRDGVVLFSKNSPVSEKEIDHRFIVNKKEWNIVASVPKPYDRFSIKTYEDYLQALERSETEMFWIINPDIHLREDFDWNFYIDHHNRYERQINHVWLNGKYYDGVFLTSKQIQLSKKEIDFRFLANKKEYTTIASDPVPFDIVFISYNEPNADENYELLKQRYSNAMRVHGVQGIHQAHIEAAKLANTDMFWVIDGDAQLLDSFDFDYQLAHYDIDGRNTVHVWRSFNPVNNLVYGYGGVKLLPTELTLNMSTDTSDMTTSISDKFKAVPAMSNSTVFNTDAFNAWKSGFRECCKLASRSIDRQVDNETEFRLNAWCTRGSDKDYGKETILGAQQGKEYGELHKDNPDALQRINDFDWLYDLFKQSCQSVE